MRYLFLFFFLPFFMISCQSDYTSSKETPVTEIFSEIYLSKESNLYQFKVSDDPVDETLTEYFNDNDRQAEIVFEDGLIQEGTVWYESGDIQMEFSNDGDFIIEKIYQEDGTLRLKITREINSVRAVAAKTWFEDGTPKSEFSPTVIRDWYSNGIKKSEANFIDGNLNGRVAKWYENGQLAGETYYVNNELDGKYLEWDEDGNLMTEKKYEMGELIEGNDS